MTRAGRHGIASDLHRRPFPKRPAGGNVPPAFLRSWAGAAGIDGVALILVGLLCLASGFVPEGDADPPEPGYTLRHTVGPGLLLVGLALTALRLLADQ